MSVPSLPAAQDVTGSPFSVGDVVSLRCTVNSASGQGAGSLVNLSLELPGVLGQKAQTFSVSPNQARRSQGGLSQPTPSGITNQAGQPFANERDIFSSPFSPNDTVSVRATVTAISGTGAGATVTATVENAGPIGVSNVVLNFGPQQCRRAQGGIAQPPAGQ